MNVRQTVLRIAFGIDFSGSFVESVGSIVDSAGSFVGSAGSFAARCRRIRDNGRVHVAESATSREQVSRQMRQLARKCRGIRDIPRETVADSATVRPSRQSESRLRDRARRARAAGRTAIFGKFGAARGENADSPQRKRPLPDGCRKAAAFPHFPLGNSGQESGEDDLPRAPSFLFVAALPAWPGASRG